MREIPFAARCSSSGLCLAAFFPSFFLPFHLLLLTPGCSTRTAAAGCIVKTQFEFDLHHVLPAMGSTAPTHEQSDYYGPRSTCKHALRVIFFQLDERILKSLVLRAREFCSRFVTLNVDRNLGEIIDAPILHEFTHTIYFLDKK